MAMTEVNVPVPALKVSGVTLDEVQGIRASVKSSPFKEGHLPALCLVSYQPPEETPQDNCSLRRISKLHGRSYEIVLGERNRLVWVDEYDNVFTQLNIKGNNCISPEIGKIGPLPSDFIAYGLQDSRSLVRMLKASDLLRSAGIDTEAILKVIEPKELFINGELVPVGEFKKRLLLKIWEKNATEGQQSEGNTFMIPTRLDLPLASKFLNESVFYITVRATQDNGRLGDYRHAPDEQTRMLMLKEAFDYLQEEGRIKALKDPSYPVKKFSIDRPEDVIKFFTEYLPKRTARNFNRLRKVGGIHYFPHTGNISRIGGFYDLDSIRAEALELEDRANTPLDFVLDINKFIQGNGGFPKPQEIISLFIGDRAQEFNEVFVREYLLLSGWDKDIRRLKEVSLLFYDGFTEDYIQDYLKRLAESEEISQIPGLKGFESFVIQEWGFLYKLFNEKPEFQSVMRNIHTYALHVIYLRLRDYIGDKIPDFVENLAGYYLNRINVKLTDYYSEEKNASEILRKSHFVKKPEEGDFKDRNRFYLQLIRVMGWEDNLISHLKDINKIFCRFYSPDEAKPLDYYVSKLPEQLGLGFSSEELSEEISKDPFKAIDWHCPEFLSELLDHKLMAGKNLDYRLEEAKKQAIAMKDSGELQSQVQEHYTQMLYLNICIRFRAEKEDQLKKIKKKHGASITENIYSMLAMNKARKLASLIDPKEWERLVKVKIDDYFKQSNMENYITLEISELMTGILELRGCEKQESFGRGRKIVSAENVPLESYLRLLSNAYDNLMIKAYTGYNPVEREIIYGSRIGYTRYFFTNGSIINLYGGKDATLSLDHNYFAWISEPTEGDETNYFLKTSLKAADLRKILRNLRIKNITFRCS